MRASLIRKKFNKIRVFLALCHEKSVEMETYESVFQMSTKDEDSRCFSVLQKKPKLLTDSFNPIQDRGSKRPSPTSKKAPLPDLAAQTF